MNKLLSIIDIIIISIGMCLLYININNKSKILDLIMFICLIVSGILTIIIQCV